MPPSNYIKALLLTIQKLSKVNHIATNSNFKNEKDFYLNVCELRTVTYLNTL